MAKLLAERGALVVDADALARAATEEPAVLAEIAATLGGELVLGGRLDRAATAARVFDDDAARAQLEAIIHPRVRRAAAALEEAALAAARRGHRRPPAVIVHDVPLLFETGRDREMDATVVVDAPYRVRLARLLQRGSLSAETIAARDARQLPAEQKRARADFVVDNSGDPAALATAVEALWPRLVALPRRP